jgi:translation initiation factor eIF-2B subunit delta
VAIARATRACCPAAVGAGREESVLNAHTSQAVAEIAGDNRSGAAQIAERAADILLHNVDTAAAASPATFRQELLATGWALIRAQPLMAPLVNLVNAVLWELEARETPDELRLAVAQATEAFKRQLRQNAQRVAEGALELIADGSTILTISHSGTVAQALLHARCAGRRFAVICLESRPACEGRAAASALAAADIPTTLVVDAAAAAMIQESQLVLVGADLLSNRGLVNKLGTRTLALAAQTVRVPFYTLCGSEKFLPSGYGPPDQREWPASEVWADAPPGVTVRNHYFEWTPLAELSGIVSEQEVLSVAEAEDHLAAIKLHPALARGGGAISSGC